MTNTHRQWFACRPQRPHHAHDAGADLRAHRHRRGTPSSTGRCV